MAVFPSVFFSFNSTSQGWTERYWYAPGATLPAVATAGVALLKLRCDMLAGYVRCVNAYASFDDEFRDVQLINIPSPPKKIESCYNAALEDTLPDQPNAVVVLRFGSGPRAGKFTYISGVPDDAIEYPPLRPAIIPAASGWLVPFNAFGNELINNSWGWKGVSYDITVSPKQNVTGMAQGAGEWTVTLPSTAGFLPGRYAKLTEGKFAGPQLPKGNRRYQIKSVASATVLVLDWGKADLSSLTYIGEGKLQAQNPAFFSIDKIALQRIGTHKRGVGYGRQRGRRKC